MLRLLAPAKVNLYLHVTGKRPDGYHLLDSLMAFADIADELEIHEARMLELSVRGPFSQGIPTDASNLVIKAAQRLAAYVGKPQHLGAKIILHKNIPVGAGLGGGSADAAAILQGLNRYWKLGIDVATLHAIGLSLGADIPICLAGKPAFVSGIGEVIEPISQFPSLPVVLVNPRKPLATPDVFRAFRGPYTEEFRDKGQRYTFAEMLALLEEKHNDLESSAEMIMPDITDILSVLQQQDGCHMARMSGSGATCFGIFSDVAATKRAVASIYKGHPAWWVAASQIQTNGQSSESKVQ